MRINQAIMILLIVGITGIWCISLSADAKINGCTFLTKDEVQTILGEPMKEPKRNVSGEVAGTDTTAAIASCSYDSVGTSGLTSDKALSFWMRISPMRNNDAPGIFDAFRTDPATSQAVSAQDVVGLGEKAYSFSRSFMGKPQLDLVVLKQFTVMKFSVRGFTDQKLALEKAKTLASKALSHLPEAQSGGNGGKLPLHITGYI